jgi:hypothetical protein
MSHKEQRNAIAHMLYLILVDCRGWSPVTKVPS